MTDDEEISAAVWVVEKRAKGCAVANRDTRNTRAGVSDPVCLAELRRRTDEDVLALHLVVLVPQLTVLTNDRAIVVAGVHTRERKTAPVCAATKQFRQRLISPVGARTRKTYSTRPFSC